MNFPLGKATSPSPQQQHPHHDMRERREFIRASYNNAIDAFYDSNDNSIQLYDQSSGHQEIDLLHIVNFLPPASSQNKSSVKSCALSPDGKYCASGGWDSKLKIHGTETGDVIELNKDKGHSTFICCVAFLDDSKTVVSLDNGGTMLFTCATSGKVFHKLASFLSTNKVFGGEEAPACFFSLSPCRTLLAVAGTSGGRLLLVDLLSLPELLENVPYLKELNGEKQIRDAPLFSTSPGLKPGCFLLRLNEFKLPAKGSKKESSFFWQGSQIHCCVWSPSGATIAVGSSDIIIVDPFAQKIVQFLSLFQPLENKEQEEKREEDNTEYCSTTYTQIYHLCFDEFEKILVSGDLAHQLTVFCLETGKKVAQYGQTKQGEQKVSAPTPAVTLTPSVPFATKSHGGEIHGVAVVGSQILSFCNDNMIRAFDFARSDHEELGKVVYKMPGKAWFFSFSRDFRKLAVACGDSNVGYFEVLLGRKIGDKIRLPASSPPPGFQQEEEEEESENNNKKKEKNHEGKVKSLQFLDEGKTLQVSFQDGSSHKITSPFKAANLLEEKYFELAKPEKRLANAFEIVEAVTEQLAN